MSIRVCQIISGDLWAGAEVMAYHLLKGMKTFDNLEIRVILLNNGNLTKKIDELGLPNFIVRESEHNFLKIAKEIRSFLKEYSPDIVHSHRYKENFLAYISSLGKGKIKLVATQHGLPENLGRSACAKENLINKANYWVLSKKFQYVVAVSEDIRRILVHHLGFPKGRVRVIHNAINVPHANLEPTKNGQFIVGSAGRFFPVKDYPFMVEICRMVYERNPRIKFELAGDGPELGTIKQRVEKYGLQKVFAIRGFQEEMNSFYGGLALYLNTSIHEGIPMSVLEAMAHGLPVIAPKVGGLNEIITDRVEGFLMQNRTPEEFAEKCIILAKDPVLRAKMSSAAQRRVLREFSAERMAKQYYDLYRMVASA